MYKHVQTYSLSWKGHFSRITPKDVSMSTPPVGFGYSLSRTSILMSGKIDKQQPRTRFGVGAPRSKAGTVAVLESRPTINLDQVQILPNASQSKIPVYEQLDEDLSVEVRINPNVVNLTDDGLQARIHPTCNIIFKAIKRPRPIYVVSFWLYVLVCLLGEGHAYNRHQKLLSCPKIGAQDFGL